MTSSRRSAVRAASTSSRWPRRRTGSTSRRSTASPGGSSGSPAGRSASGVQLPRQPRGGHDGALPPHHPALLGLQSSVRDRREPGPAVPVLRRRAREGGRAGRVRHGSRDVVRRARRHAEVVVAVATARQRGLELLERAR